ncbi:MAG: hypothetical protein KKA64_00810 [Nanoarchaeota archaeon]|nr:hypothetical protein [Nanoarchaeota archaeon]
MIGKRGFSVSKRSQITIFVIIAIVLVAGIVLFFVFRGEIFPSTIPKNFAPLYTTFLSCAEQYTETGVNVLESQGGYIYMPDFEPGSSYMPFSSQLDFLGNPIPYWYYVSGNNFQKEQVPSKSGMEEQLARFVEEKISKCRLDDYYGRGFEISLGAPRAIVKITDEKVDVSLNMNLGIKKGEDSAVIKDHQIEVKTKLGKLYGTAIEVYNYEQQNLFLENYAVDTLRLYAPVDGVEITCSPEIWKADEVFSKLQDAIEVNTLALRVKNGDYTLKNEENKYFIIDIPTDEDVRFFNSKEWSYGFEVEPSEGSLLMANPVGNQPGLGIMGFCYIPYHFVYNLRYPVLVQVINGEEIFQFPVAVVIQGNKPRKALEGSQALDFGLPELCRYANTKMDIKVYDTKLNPVDADISFECLGAKCYIGKAQGGVLSENFPQCVNGDIITKAEGFAEGRYVYSTTQEGNADIILDKLKSVDVNLNLDGKPYNEAAIISFNSEKNSKTVVYPEQKTVELIEGQYEITVYIYRSSELTLPATTQKQCVDVSSGGLGALFGLTKKKCFDIQVPEQLISNALAGGGKQNYYILESELESSNIAEINAQGMPAPKTIEELQTNYELFENKNLGIQFK